MAAPLIATSRIRVQGRFPYEGAAHLFRGTTEVGQSVLLSVVPAALAKRAAAAAGMEPVVRGTLESGDVYLGYGIPAGETLAQRLESQAMGWTSAARAILPAVRTLAELHRKGEVYRELAPNVMVLRLDGTVALVGREIKRLALAVDRRKVSMPPMDTIPYLSPERTRGGSVSPASDVFSMAAILFEAVTGFRAFDARDLFELIHQIQTQEVPELAKYDPNVPTLLSKVVAAAMHKDPERRPTADALVGALEEAARIAVVTDEALNTEPDILATPVPGSDLAEAVKLVAELKTALAEAKLAKPEESAEAEPMRNENPASPIVEPPLPVPAELPRIAAHAVVKPPPLPPVLTRAKAVVPQVPEAAPAELPVDPPVLTAAVDGIGPASTEHIGPRQRRSASALALRRIASQLRTMDLRALAIAFALVVVLGGIVGAVASHRSHSKIAPVPKPAVVTSAIDARPAVEARQMVDLGALDGMKLTLLPTSPKAKAAVTHRTARPAKAETTRAAEPVRASDAADELLGLESPPSSPAARPQRSSAAKRTAADAAFDEDATIDDDTQASSVRRRPIRASR